MGSTFAIVAILMAVTTLATLVVYAAYEKPITEEVEEEVEEVLGFIRAGVSADRPISLQLTFVCTDRLADGHRCETKFSYVHNASNFIIPVQEFGPSGIDANGTKMFLPGANFAKAVVQWECGTHEYFTWSILASPKSVPIETSIARTEVPCPRILPHE